MPPYTPLKDRNQVAPQYMPVSERGQTQGPYVPLKDRTQGQSFYTSLRDRLASVGNSFLDLFSSHLTATNGPPPPPPPVATIRDIPFSTQAALQAKKSIFSEISDRLKPIEVTAMLNVAVNKARETKKPIEQILTDPNFFQGVTNKRYATSSNPQGQDKTTWDFVNKTVDEALAGNLPDHTKGATHFVHITSGPYKNAAVTMTEKEFTTYLSKGKPDSKERNDYALKLLGL